MENVSLDLLGRLILDQGAQLKRIEERLTRIEDHMATREHVTRLWRLMEDRMALGRTELVDADSALSERLAALEERIAALEESRAP